MTLKHYYANNANCQQIDIHQGRQQCKLIIFLTMEIAARALLDVLNAQIAQPVKHVRMDSN